MSKIKLIQTQALLLAYMKARPNQGFSSAPVGNSNTLKRLFMMGLIKSRKYQNFYGYDRTEYYYEPTEAEISEYAEIQLQLTPLVKEKAMCAERLTVLHNEFRNVEEPLENQKRQAEKAIKEIEDAYQQKMYQRIIEEM